MLPDAISRIDKKKFILLLSFLFLVVAAEIVLTTIIPLWRNYFYDILENKQAELFVHSLLYFAGMMVGLGAAQGLKVWAGQLVSFEVRKAATKLLFKPWVKGSRRVANYTQAMTEALRNATELYLEISVEVIISGAIVVSLVLLNWRDPSLLLAAAMYTIGMTVVAAFFNKPMVSSDIEWQSREGEFRETLSYLYSGENCFSFKERLELLTLAYYKYIRVVMYFTLFSRVKAALGSLVPYLILSYPFFAGEISLGQFMKGVGSFELIVINSTILLVLYPKLTKAKASYQISKAFYQEVKR